MNPDVCPPSGEMVTITVRDHPSNGRRLAPTGSPDHHATHRHDSCRAGDALPDHVQLYNSGNKATNFTDASDSTDSTLTVNQATHRNGHCQRPQG